MQEYRIPAEWEREAGEVEALVGEKLAPDPKPYNLLLGGAHGRQGAARVMSADGSLLAVYLPGWVSSAVGRQAYRALAEGKMIH